MNRAQLLSRCRRLRLFALAGFALCLQAPLAVARDINYGQAIETVATESQNQPVTLEQRAQVTYDTYILGPGDGLEIELLDLPELGGLFSIGPDGILYLPRLRALNVEGLTVEELRNLLTQKFSTYVRDPQVYVRPVVYRPVRIYVGGEVKRPGYYTLVNKSNLRLLSDTQQGEDRDQNIPELGLSRKTVRDYGSTGSSSSNLISLGTVFPTVFDAIQSARGITPFTDLSQVQVIRKRAEGLGGGRIKTNLNFLSLITEGNESQNIRLFDGDTLNIGKSPIVLRDQLLTAGRSNLNPQFMEVYVTGRVTSPGGVNIRQGSTLNQAISVAGGTKFLKGKIEFVRINREGTIDRRIFAHRPGAAINAPSNPILAAGDVIRVNDSLLSGSVDAINELTRPIISAFSAYALFQGFN